MDLQKATEDAIRTDPSEEQYKAAYDRLHSYEIMRVLHVAMGLSTEAGEFMDQLKRQIFYGEKQDWGNLIEESGDITWYLRIFADVLRSLKMNVDFEKIIESNIQKLRQRFPDKFSGEQAINRNVVNEVKVFEKLGAVATHKRGVILKILQKTHDDGMATETLDDIANLIIKEVM